LQPLGKFLFTIKKLLPLSTLASFVTLFARQFCLLPFLFFTAFALYEEDGAAATKRSYDGPAIMFPNGTFVGLEPFAPLRSWK